MDLIIKQIKTQELDIVCEIMNAVVFTMKASGFTQWDKDYPTREILLKDVERGELYGAYIGDIIAGFAAINRHQSEEYCEIPWKFGDAFLVVHRLQVDPIFRGKHIAYEIMLFAEKLAKEQGLKSIRLDTRYDNVPAISLYSKLGYVKRGHVHFPRMIEYEFPCLEKEIK